MSVDPAVRSVRVAVALSDRFAELLKGPDTVRSHKQAGALVGFAGDQTGMSLRIGEAQQIYPEIWQHLDEARAQFAARGIDVTAYDAIRASEGKGIGAAVDVVATRHGVGNYAVDEQVKSANFNREGLARAKQAIAALTGATPQIDWAAIARAEDEDPAAVAFGRSTRIKRWISLSLIAIVIASPFIYLIRRHLKASADHDERMAAIRRDEAATMPARPAVPAISDAKRAQLAATSAQLRSVVANARTAWPSVVAPDALAAIAPGTEPCEAAFDGPQATGADRYIRDNDPSAVGRGSFDSYLAGKPVPDDHLADMAATLDAIDAKLAANRGTDNDTKRLATLDTYVVFLVIDHEVAPVISATAPKLAYTAGRVTGRAFVFVVPGAKIVCSAKIDVRNTASNATAQFDDLARIPEPQRPEYVAAVLHRELEIRIRQALAADLRATRR